MLFEAAVRKDLARTFAATLVVILTIVITMFLIKTLGQAASGSVAPQDVVLLLGYTALGHMSTMLTLSMFVAIVVTLGRMYRESEMVIWFASGVGLSRFVRPVLWTAAPVLAVVMLIMFFVWPWVNAKGTELRDRYTQRSDLSRVTPGVFQSSRDGSRVFFVERESVDGINARNVFIVTRQRDGESVVSARNGRLETADGDRFLVLERGQRNETDAGSGERTLSSFENYRVLADDAQVRKIEAPPPKAMGTMALIENPSPGNQGELAWRFGIVLAAGNLLLLGVGLSATNPRRPGNWNLIFALLAFIVYFNLVTLSQGWISLGRFSLGTALFALHGAVFVLALMLLWWREHGTTISLARRTRTGPSPA
jgi:lipopolysaccharide export system permease protein